MRSPNPFRNVKLVTMHLLRPWLLLIAAASILKAQDNQEPEDPFGLNDQPGIAAADRSTAEIAATTRGSLVVVTQKGRDGQTAGTGSGFVLSKDGLIATCAHVIGESRPVIIRFEDGEEHEVTAIHMGCVVGTMLAHQNPGDGHGHAAEHLAVGIDVMP